MTFSYSGHPGASDLDEIRFYLGDVDTADPILSDEEIIFYQGKLLTVFGNNLATASYLADLIAGRMAREVSISGDGVTIGADALQQKYQALAKLLREQWRAIAGAGGGPDVGGILWGEEMDPTVKPLTFAKGVNDNTRAGQQEYGGVLTNRPGYREGSWYGGDL